MLLALRTKPSRIPAPSQHYVSFSKRQQEPKTIEPFKSRKDLGLHRPFDIDRAGERNSVSEGFREIGNPSDTLQNVRLRALRILRIGIAKFF